MIFHPVENTAVTSGGGYSPRRYRFSLLTAVATFILIIAGGLVTSQQAGDSVPDWPLNFGRIVPWEQLVGNVRFEYGHRVIATTVGLLTILLNIVLWRDERRRWVRQLGLVALAAVVLQGLLGGVRVLLLEYRVPVAIIHACLAQTFFSLIVGLTVFTSRAWFDMSKPESGARSLQNEDDGRETAITNHPSAQTNDGIGQSEKTRFAATMGTAAVIAIFLQLLLGAAFRHGWMGIIPHLLGAGLVAVLLGWTLLTILKHIPSIYLQQPARWTFGLLVVQLGLGIAAYFARVASYDDPQPLFYMVSLTVAHVAGGALTLAMAVVIVLRLYRLRVQASEASSHTSDLRSVSWSDV